MNSESTPEQQGNVSGGSVKPTKREITLVPVSHTLGNDDIGKMAAANAAKGDAIVAVELSIYLGGFIPLDARRDNIQVMLEPPTMFTGNDGGRSPTHLYLGGREIEPKARGLRRMFETIASEIESEPDEPRLRLMAHELLHLRRRHPNAVIFNEPSQWLRTVWYESDLMFHYMLLRNRYRLFGAFIYSDLDEEFAGFLAKHGNAISALTGDNCLLFAFDGQNKSDSQLYLGAEYVSYRSVVEDEKRLQGMLSAADLDKQREVEARMLSEVNGINRSVLFGRKLGVRAEEMPCIAFWETLDEKRVVTFLLQESRIDARNYADKIKRFAGEIADIVASGSKDLLGELKRRTGTSYFNREHESPVSIRNSLRSFLSDNTPPIRERLHPEDIDNFQRIRDIAPQDVAGLLDPNGWLDVSEDEVQSAFEEILAVPFHKVDWGGESNDLYSANLQVNGVRLPTAFLLKGNGLKKREMQIADCGKNGDQILRLFASPAYLFVIQFVGNIAEAVISDVQGKIAERRTSGRPAWYLIIDGQDTARLLRAYSKKFVAGTMPAS